MALVVMDAGHGGSNPGAVYGGRQEKDDALALTLAVGQILEQNGVEVYYTRTSDVYESPYQKAQEGNNAQENIGAAEDQMQYSHGIAPFLLFLTSAFYRQIHPIKRTENAESQLRDHDRFIGHNNR